MNQQRGFASRRSYFCRIVVVTLVAGCAPGLGAESPSPRPSPGDFYRVTWREGPKAEVEAILYSPTCTFSTAPKWTSFFGDGRGWNRFHSKLRATDANGRLVAPVSPSRETPGAPAEDGAHRFGDGGPCDLRLTYEVDFAFGRESWPAGNEQVAWVGESVVYTTGLPLFLRGGDDRPAEVEIVVPQGWSIATPWIAFAPRRAGAATRYSVAHESALLENVLVVGKIAPVTFRAGNLEVVAVLLGDLTAGLEPLRDVFTLLAPRLGELFHDGRSGRYLFAFLPGDEDGESYADSFGVSTRAVPTAENRIIWANHLAHELIHFWIGKGIRPAEADLDAMQWFVEGFTEYLANRTLHEVGVFDDRTYFDRLGRHLGYYLLTRQNPNFQNLSPAAAGAAKWKNRPLVYSGGVAIALCLDARIRADSTGRRGLDDLLGALADRAAQGERLTPANLLQAASAIAGTDLTAFFAHYVAGTDDLPIEAGARELGMRALVQGYDVFVDRAPRTPTP